MVTIGNNKNKNICAICKERIQTGETVYLDHTKSRGNHMVHHQCGKELLESREQKFFKTPKGAVVVTREELDPPF